MWACLTKGFASVLLLHELFTATSWQIAKTTVFTLWAMAMAASCGIQFFIFFFNRKYSFAFYSFQATFQVFNILQISHANKNIVQQDAWKRKLVSFYIRKSSLLHILLFLTPVYLAGRGKKSSPCFQQLILSEITPGKRLLKCLI